MLIPATSATARAVGITPRHAERLGVARRPGFGPFPRLDRSGFDRLAAAAQFYSHKYFTFLCFFFRVFSYDALAILFRLTR